MHESRPAVMRLSTHLQVSARAHIRHRDPDENHHLRRCTARAPLPDTAPPRPPPLSLSHAAPHTFFPHSSRAHLCAQRWHSSPPEPYLWQRLVGMLASGQGHPESIAPLLDRTSLPHSGAVLAINQRALRRSHMAAASSSSSCDSSVAVTAVAVTAVAVTTRDGGGDDDGSGDGDGDGDGVTPPVDTLAVMGPAATKAPRCSGGGLPEVDTGRPTHGRSVF